MSFLVLCRCRCAIGLSVEKSCVPARPRLPAGVRAGCWVPRQLSVAGVRAGCWVPRECMCVCAVAGYWWLRVRLMHHSSCCSLQSDTSRCCLSYSPPLVHSLLLAWTKFRFYVWGANLPLPFTLEVRPSPPLSPSLLSFRPSLPLDVGPLNPARGSGERYKLPQRGLVRAPAQNRIWCILALKYDISWLRF